ncbi:Uridine kinase [Kluyveromyces marxianus]|uniref:Uridine kinase n=2 Tax=Kluyveromyces marxianus TaxID=4911 RepID=W0TEH1_KLUMD|nr:uridine kinase [Kluyveromyces marxianus DMKU3-1042]QGN17089.1 uridine kinase [Kluyveromyces marxianus]BAO41755.1 uridine kinase [Kluyveromyces marxianus DMKU3-1042]BAP73199.1 uridine kinase [Kluyveromyces marxianus]
MNHSGYIPPWTTPYIIGVAGSSGSGKTSVASKIVSEINTPWTVLISLDNFYKPLSPADKERAFNNDYDFDKPEAIDLDLAYECILSLKEGKKVKIPTYSFTDHDRIPNKHLTIYGASVVILEGIYALYDQRLLDLMDLKVYVDADLDVCLARRLSRDIVSRGRDLQGCIRQWEKFVKPNAELYLKPTMKVADAIIPSISDNTIATEILLNHIQSKLQDKSQQHLAELKKLGTHAISIDNLDTVIRLPQTNQVKALQTMLLDKTISRDDFVFYFDRLASILLSFALDDIPEVESDKKVITPTNVQLKNPVFVDFDKVTAINIVRSGDCFMSSLRKTIPSVAVGKLLIQSDSRTGEPQLHCLFIPPKIESFNQVLLMDAQIISGSAIIMALQVLVDHHIELKNIKVIVYLATETGIRRIVDATNNQVKIYAGEIISDERIRSNQCNWGRRHFVDTCYFGC